jgi:hypothetical protein
MPPNFLLLGAIGFNALGNFVALTMSLESLGNLIKASTTNFSYLT